MAEDRTPDPADQPEDDKTPPQDNPPEPYRLGGSGGSGKSPDDRPASGDEPDQPVRGIPLVACRRGHECPRRPVAKRLCDARRRRLDVHAAIQPIPGRA